MDEPLTNLDAKLRETLRVELVVLRREVGTPMIYVTHDQVEALSMGDRLVVLSAGRILQQGTPEEIYRHPVSPLVAQQLGQPAINLFEVRHVQGYWVTATGVRVMPAGRGGGERLIGVRPEDIASEGGTQAGRVRVVEDTGPNWILLVDWGGCDIHLRVDKDHRFRPGDPIFPRVNAARAVVWEREVR
jgi:ABC-type sugar transport system ATPase subunit